MEKKTAILTFRLPHEEFERFQEAAHKAKESQSEYARTAIRERIQGGVRAASGISSQGYVLGNRCISFDTRTSWTTGTPCSYWFELKSA